MTEPILPPEETLDRYLNGKKNSGLPPTDAALTKSLLAAASAAQPDPKFAAQLEARLKQPTRFVSAPASANQPSFLNLFWSPSVKRLSTFALLTLLLLLLVVGGAWLLQPRPQPALPDVATVTTTADLSATPEALGTEALSTESAPAPETAEPATAAPATEAPAAPVQFAPGVSFPSGPATTNLYTQSSQPLTVETVQQMAEHIGIHGLVYSFKGEGNDPVYVVTDGQARITFVSSPDTLYFVTNYLNILNSSEQPVAEEQGKSIATEFLKAHNLLPADYEIETDPAFANTFAFRPIVDGLPLTQGNSNPLINVALTSNGEVQSVSYSGPQLALFGNLPLISAEEAWQKANDSSGRSVQASSFYVAPPTVPYLAWARQYQPDEAVDMTGYLEVLQPADPSNLPFLDLNNFPLNGNLEGLAAQGNSTIHVLGHLTLDEGGRPWLTVDQWNTVAQSDFNVTGQVERDGTDTFLVLGDKRYRLADVPADVPTGVDLDVRGVAVDDADSRFEWWLIASQGSGGGGGGGGGSGVGFAEISLTPVAQVTAPVPTPFAPYQIGDAVEDVHGELGVTLQQNLDGSQETQYRVSIYSATSGYSLNLIGDKVTGNEKYNFLPVRVWGTITAIHPESYSLDVQADRIEPVYPDLHIQAWLGNDAIATVSGQKVDLISSEDGQKLVVDFTINPPAGYEPSPMSSPDVKSIYEGYIVPDQTFGGYPVVHIFSTASGNDLDLSTYQMRSSQIPVVNPPGTGSIPSTLTIEKIELAYLIQDFSHGSPQPAADCPCRIVQPVWRFTGHTSDGQGYEIDVQAVSDDYLK